MSIMKQQPLQKWIPTKQLSKQELSGLSKETIESLYNCWDLKPSTNWPWFLQIFFDKVTLRDKDHAMSCQLQIVNENSTFNWSCRVIVAGKPFLSKQHLLRRSSGCHVIGLLYWACHPTGNIQVNTKLHTDIAHF